MLILFANGYHLSAKVYLLLFLVSSPTSLCDACQTLQTEIYLVFLSI